MSKKAYAERRDLEPAREDDDAPEGTPLMAVLSDIREALDKLVEVQTAALTLRAARQRHREAMRWAL